MCNISYCHSLFLLESRATNGGRFQENNTVLLFSNYCNYVSELPLVKSESICVGLPILSEHSQEVSFFRKLFQIVAISFLAFKKVTLVTHETRVKKTRISKSRANRIYLSLLIFKPI